MSDPVESLGRELHERAASTLYRHRLMLESPQGTHIRIDGQDYLAFCSNDYLSLANHPRLIAAVCEGAKRYGVGAGASHLISGHSSAHHAQVKSQNDRDKLADAHTEVYRAGFYEGVMLVGEHTGKKVGWGFGCWCGCVLI